MSATSALLESLLGDEFTLEVALEAAPGWVYGYPGRLEHVLTNLVVNARDAMMPGGGQIHIRTRDLPRNEAGPTGAPRVHDGPVVAITVSDRGPGIPEGSVDQIFDAFFTTKAVGRGAGLGLSIVRAMVSEAGGLVRARPRPGGGTTLEVVLRAAADPAAARFERRAVAAPSASGNRALLVEDHDMVREYVRGELERAGYTVEEAASYNEAENLLPSACERYDLLISDISLPDGSGAELARRFAGEAPALTTVLVSAFPKAWLVAQGKVDPDAEVLVKPFDGTELLARLDELARNASASSG